MPEGPEIRRAADVVADALVGDVVTPVRFGLPALRRAATRLKNHRVIDVETRGKAMLTHFDHGWSIYSHNQLYGVWHVFAGRELPRTNRSLRLLLQTRDYSAILYSASDISVWRTENLQEHPFLARLGPDIMDGTLGWRDIAARLQVLRAPHADIGGAVQYRAVVPG
ncbi:MAG: DNA-formamidopyrimidine glycosylase family protein, partial [Halioglobus sp.]